MTNKIHSLVKLVYTAFFLSFIAPHIILAASEVKILNDTPPAAYEKIADLEVRVKVPGKSWGNQAKEIITFGKYNSPAQAERIKEKLRERLKQKAKHFKADAIANVRYYPDPEKETFFRGDEVYARGTLVKFPVFPAEAKEKRK